MSALHEATHQTCLSLSNVLMAVERHGGRMTHWHVLNARHHLVGLQFLEREAKGGQPKRRAWSLGQASVPVLFSILNGLAKSVDGAADTEIEACRDSLNKLADALTDFAEGRVS